MTTTTQSQPQAAGAPKGEVAAHTPTPYYDESTNRVSANIVSADRVIAHVYDKRDRAFIVRACNSHAALVEALEQVLRLHDRSNATGYIVTDSEKITQARAALALAKEGQS